MIMQTGPQRLPHNNNNQSFKSMLHVIHFRSYEFSPRAWKILVLMPGASPPSSKCCESVRDSRLPLVPEVPLELSLVVLDPFSPLPLCLPTSRASFLLLKAQSSKVSAASYLP